MRDLWQKVEARMDCSHPLTAFLTQKIDDCGQTVAFDAFNLVHKTLNPEGFVRIAHKSADQPLGSAITMPDSPWTAEGSMIDRQWDFQGTWRRYSAKWPVMNKYTNLKKGAIDRFCTPCDVDAQGRHLHAKYKNIDEDIDSKYSMPALDANQAPLELLETLPDDVPGKAIQRWEVICGAFVKEAYASTLDNKSVWNGVPHVPNVAGRDKKTLTVVLVQELYTKLRGKYDKSDDFRDRMNTANDGKLLSKTSINGKNKFKWFRIFRNFQSEQGDDPFMPELDELVDDDDGVEEQADKRQNWTREQLMWSGVVMPFDGLFRDN